MSATIQVSGVVRRWDPAKPGGLAVVDIPLQQVPLLGGRRQIRVTGTIDGQPFTGSTMLVAGGGFCVGISRTALRTAGADVGSTVELVLTHEDG